MYARQTWIVVFRIVIEVFFIQLFLVVAIVILFIHTQTGLWSVRAYVVSAVLAPRWSSLAADAIGCSRSHRAATADFFLLQSARLAWVRIAAVTFFTCVDWIVDVKSVRFKRHFMQNLLAPVPYVQIHKHRLFFGIDIIKVVQYIRNHHILIVVRRHLRYRCLRLLHILVYWLLFLFICRYRSLSFLSLLGNKSLNAIYLFFQWALIYLRDIKLLHLSLNREYVRNFDFIIINFRSLFIQW